MRSSHEPSPAIPPRNAATITLLAALLMLGAVGCSDDDAHIGDAGAEPDVVDTGSPPDPDTDAETDADSDADGDTDTDTPISYDLALEGLSAPVTVRYDEWGVLHLDCETPRDCYLAQGYFHADDRFFEMDLIRRQTLGTLSSLIGLNFGLGNDEKFRHLMTTRKGKPLEDAYLEQMGEPAREMLRAYADGVNAWLDDMRNGDNGAELSSLYDLSLIHKENIPDWKPQHSIALYLQLAYQLSFSSNADLFRGEMIAKLGADTATDLFTVKPGQTSNIFQSAGVQSPMSHPPESEASPGDLARARSRLAPAADALEQARERIETWPSLIFGPKTPSDGSNNWVVGPDQTRDGVTLLANDPHLSLNNPPIWHFIEMHAESSGGDGLHVAGGSIPSVPGIVVGQNEHIAWGVTTARLDLADAYTEQLNADGSAVIRNGNEIPLIEKEYTFEGPDGNTQTRTFEWVSGHGPLISKDMSNQTGVSVKWVAQKAGSDFDFLRQLMNAETVDGAMSALGPIRTINQCWVVIDDQGSIGWYPRGAIPKRPWASTQTPNWLPLPGDGSAEWQGYVAEENAPKLKNPPNGFLATANNDFDGSYADGDSTNDGHTPWQAPPTIGNRHKRIIERLEEGAGSHTADTMRDIQADTHSLHGETLVPHVLDAADASGVSLSSGAQTVVSALRDWEYDCPTGLDGTDPDEASKASDPNVASESIGCAAFHVLLPELTDAVFGDELDTIDGANALSDWDRLQSALLLVFDNPSALNRGTAYFDDISTENTQETRGEIVAAALDATATELQDEFGSSTADDWRWGRIHTVTFQNLLGNPVASEVDLGPYVNDGGFDTVDVADPRAENGNYGHPNGPSLRVVFRASDEGVEGWFQLPGGQVFDSNSKYYKSLVDEWLRNESRKLLFERDEVAGAAETTIRIEPDG